jgi:hypothetical protein
MDKNKVKIELYKSKVMAKFSHYVSGNLYYTVEMEEGTFQFPIATVEYFEAINSEMKELALSSDLGTTSFYNEMKGSELNRWIGKAIDKGEFTKVG